MRDHILSEIRRLAAAQDGQPPGAQLFTRETGIGQHLWRGKFWARWGDALTEAGFAPNAWVGRTDQTAAIEAFIASCRHYGRFPTFDEYGLYRRSQPGLPSAKAVRQALGGRDALVAALADYARERDAADILPMLPDVATPPAASSLGTTRDSAKEGFVYLIRSGEFFKIGRSDDIERRVREIRVALPDKAELVHSIRTDDPPGIEGYWHRRFAGRRANGEWFRLTSLDVSAFRKRKFQ